MAEKPKKGRPGKRLFLGMALVTVLLAALFLFVFWILTYPGLKSLSVWLPRILGGLFLLFNLICLFAVGDIILAMSGRVKRPLCKWFSYWVILTLFPVTARVGRLFGIDRRRMEGSFIEVNNVLFLKRGIKVPANRLLVLAPHCLQLASCPHKITYDPDNCRRCGGCNIGDLVKLSEEKGFHFLVATGGTVARQFVKKNRPKVILAIACERDLMSGMQDVFPMPGIGILNDRPNGPCFNTRVDMDAVREAVERITA